MDVMTAGRMAVFADPVGAAFGVWQPGDHKGAALVNEPGTFSWSELVTTDIPASKAFYGAVFGWGAETHGEGPGAYTEWQVNGRSIGGMMQKPPQMPAEVPPFWAVYFAVTDTDDALARVTGLGGAVDNPADGHRARPIRRRRRSDRCRVQRDRVQRRAGRLTPR